MSSAYGRGVGISDSNRGYSRGSKQFEQLVCRGVGGGGGRDENGVCVCIGICLRVYFLTVLCLGLSKGARKASNSAAPRFCALMSRRAETRREQRASRTRSMVGWCEGAGDRENSSVA